MKHFSRRKPIIGINVNYYKDPENKSSAGECRVGFDYVSAVHAAGGLPLLTPCLADEEILRSIIGRVDGFLFIGGADYPPHLYGQDQQPEVKLLSRRRVATDLILARLARQRQIPVLGICGGHQLINIERGGALIQHIPRAKFHQRGPDKRRRFHQATVAGGKILRAICGTQSFLVNSSHHQAVDPQNPGAGLQITAYATDGTVEAIEAPRERFVLGVQWHPEGMPKNQTQCAIFRAFIEAARKTGNNPSFCASRQPRS